MAPPDIWSWGPWIGLLLAIVLAALPVILSRMANRDKIDQERRDRADKADQERRDKADEERRAQAALLLTTLQLAVDRAERRLEAQTKDFTEALTRRDKQNSDDLREVTNGLRGLTTAIDSLQRRQQP
jgi:hypothetical protein